MTSEPMMRVTYHMKFRPLSLCWFLANECADAAFARNPKIPRSEWLRIHLPKPVTVEIPESEWRRREESADG